MKLEKFHKGKYRFNAKEFRTSQFLQERNKGDKRKGKKKKKKAEKVGRTDSRNLPSLTDSLPNH